MLQYVEQIIQEFSGEERLDLGGWGCYNMRASVFNTEPGWAEQVLVEAKFHRGFISKWPNFELQSIHGKK
jgi:hypothetical protein